MVNFSPGAMLKTSRETSVGKRFTFTTQAVRTPKFIFQPGLKFECDYMRFFSPFDRAEISSPVSQTGLEISARAETQPGVKLSSCNRKRLLRRFVQEAELKSQPGLKFAM